MKRKNEILRHMHNSNTNNINIKNDEVMIRMAILINKKKFLEDLEESTKERSNHHKNQIQNNHEYSIRI